MEGDRPAEWHRNAEACQAGVRRRRGQRGKVGRKHDSLKSRLFFSGSDSERRRKEIQSSSSRKRYSPSPSPPPRKAIKVEVKEESVSPPPSPKQANKSVKVKKYVKVSGICNKIAICLFEKEDDDFSRMLSTADTAPARPKKPKSMEWNKDVSLDSFFLFIENFLLTLSKTLISRSISTIALCHFSLQPNLLPPKNVSRRSSDFC